jgi:hypothetical protein
LPISGDGDLSNSSSTEETLPMDRPIRIVTVASLNLLVALAAASLGCRSTKSEVPPGRPYSTGGGQVPAVGFSAEPRPDSLAGSGAYGVAPGSNTSLSGDPYQAAANGQVQYGTPTPSSANLGAPTPNRYGPPGTAGLTPANSATAGSAAPTDPFVGTTGIDQSAAGAATAP